MAAGTPYGHIWSGVRLLCPRGGGLGGLPHAHDRCDLARRRKGRGGMVSLVNRHDGLVGVVFLVCLARVVFAGGVDRPRDVSATQAFAGDDENVVDLTLVERWAEFLD